MRWTRFCDSALQIREAYSQLSEDVRARRTPRSARQTKLNRVRATVFAVCPRSHRRQQVHPVRSRSHGSFARMCLWQALKEFRDRFSCPEGYRLTETNRQHLEAYMKQRQWTHRPMTLQQLEHLYQSEQVARNVVSWLKERGHYEFSEMHGCELYDHPETQIVISHSVSKSKKTEQKTSLQTLGWPPASGSSGSDGGASDWDRKMEAILDDPADNAAGSEETRQVLNT